MPETRFYSITFKLGTEESENFNAFELELRELLNWANCEMVKIQSIKVNPNV